MKTNTKTRHSHVYDDVRTAGGYGVHGAKQPEESQLRRLVMACLLWEDIAYADGESVVEQIRRLVPLVEPDVVAAMAVEARTEQKLRHVPLLLCRELARNRTLNKDTLATVIQRPDEMAEFLAMYWQDGKCALASSVKRGLAKAFTTFDAYQLAKWNRRDRNIKLRDVMFMTHPKPENQEQAQVWKQLVDGTLPTPDTWEVGLSAAKTDEEKRDVWTRLLESRKLGALALLKNLRNMQDVGVPVRTVLDGLKNCRPSRLLPIDFIRAAKAAPDFTQALETLMYRCAEQWPKLNGHTLFIVDVSGSMNQAVSSQSGFTRMDVAAAMTVLANEMCEHISVWATAGSDARRTHQTAKMKPYRGFALADLILSSVHELGGGGIFTRQCLDFIRQHDETPDRIIVFSDSQDCDYPGSGQPKPFGNRNYIVDISSHTHGVNYRGLWDAEVCGWSESFLKFIAEFERPNQNA